MLLLTSWNPKRKTGPDQGPVLYLAWQLGSRAEAFI